MRVGFSPASSAFISATVRFIDSTATGWSAARTAIKALRQSGQVTEVPPDLKPLVKDLLDARQRGRVAGLLARLQAVPGWSPSILNN